MKKIYCAFIVLMSFSLFAQSIDTVSEEAEESAIDESENTEETFSDAEKGEEDTDESDFDLLFEDAEDSDAVITTEENTKGTVVAKIGDVSIPLRWSGYMESSLGGGGVRENRTNEYSAYFAFQNYLYLNARPDKTLSLYASLVTTLPSSSKVFSISEMYFTYLLFDSVFISAGRKDTSWGYVRLIGTVDDTDDKADVVAGTAYKYGGVSTDILSDSSSGTSGLIRIPFWTGTISLWGYYADSYGSASSMSSDKLSFAVSIEETIFKTSINLFARKYPNVAPDGTVYTAENRTQFHIMGAEAKRTIFDADVYAQCIGQVKSAGDVFKRHDIKGFSELVATAGLYKWWDKHDPNVGFNVEFQDIYFPETSNHNRCIAYDAGIKRLGKRKNIKIGASGYHSITDKNGYVKPGVIITGLFPHAEWDNGLRIDYGESSSYVSPKYTFGSYIKITLNY